MKFELFRVVAAVEALNRITEDNEIPFTLAWKISDLVEVMQKHYDRFNDEKNVIVKKFGVAQEGGTEIFEIPAKRRAEFETELKKITDIEVEIGKFEKLARADIIAADLKISKGVSISALKPFITEK